MQTETSGSPPPASAPSPAPPRGRPHYRIISRYFTREVLGPTVLAFVIYTFLMVMNQMWLVAEYAHKLNVPLQGLGGILLLQIPNVVVLTLPMSILAGILLATARMSADSELVALSANGISILRLLRPLLWLALLFSALTTWFSYDIVPRANYKFSRTVFALYKQNVLNNLKPREINSRLFPGSTLYVREIEQSPGGVLWKSVFFDPGSSAPGGATAGARNELFFARQVQPLIDEDGQNINLLLTDVTVHSWTAGSKSYDVRKMGKFTKPLPPPDLGKAGSGAMKSVRERTVPELLDGIARESATPGGGSTLHRLLRVELHKRFAIPFACVVFAVLGLGLGSGARRGGRSYAFLWSLVVFVVYQQLFYVGERMAVAQNIPLTPWLSMWAGNILFGLVGLLLLVKRVTEGRAFAWLAPLDPRPLLLRLPRPRLAWLRRRLGIERSEGSARAVRRLSWPRILDRYVLALFLRVLVLVVLGSFFLYFSVSLFQLSDDIFKPDKDPVPVSVVVELYKAWLPEMMTYILPVAMLVATIVTFSLLTRTNEVAAMLLSGIPVYRIVVPVLLAGTAITALSLRIYDPWLPRSSERYDDVMDIIRGNPPRSTLLPVRWVAHADGQRFYTYRAYRGQQGSFDGFTVIETSIDPFVPVRRVHAKSARWTDHNDLRMEDGWERSFRGGVVRFEPFHEHVVPFSENRRDFGREWRKTKHMTYDELSDYIIYRKVHGLRVRDLEIELAKKRALPFMGLVMMVVALPFAFSIGRQGKLHGIGVAIVIAVTYYCATVVSAHLGNLGILTPALAAWAPSIAFLLTSFAGFLSVRT